MSSSASRPVELYHLAFSHYCEKARRILEYKKIPFRLVNVPYGDHDAVIRVSGQDYVPLIRTTEGASVTWGEIADWAEEQVSTPTLYPAGRPLARILDHWAHNIVEEAAWVVALPRMAATLSDPHEAWIFEEMQMRRRGSLAVVAMRHDELAANLCAILAMPEEALGATAYLQGEAPSLADFALYGALRPLEIVGVGLPASLPRLHAWWERVATV